MSVWFSLKCDQYGEGAIFHVYAPQDTMVVRLHLGLACSWHLGTSMGEAWEGGGHGCQLRGHGCRGDTMVDAQLYSPTHRGGPLQQGVVWVGHARTCMGRAWVKGEHLCTPLGMCSR